MSQYADCESQVVAGSLELLLMECSGEGSLNDIVVVQISRTEYIKKCFHDIVDHIPQNRLYVHAINGSLIVDISDFTFEHRARAVRRVIRTRGNSRLNKGRTFTKKTIPLENIPT